MVACDYRLHIHGTVLMPEDLARAWLSDMVCVGETGVCTVQAVECVGATEPYLRVAFDSFVVSCDDDFDRFLMYPVSAAEERAVYGGLEVYYEADMEDAEYIHAVVIPQTQATPVLTLRQIGVDNCVVADEVLKFLWGDRARYGTFADFVTAAEAFTQKEIEQWIHVEAARYRAVGDVVPLVAWAQQQKGGERNA